MSPINRTTSELLIIMFAVTVCGVLIVTVLVLLTVAILKPDTDIAEAARLVGELTSTLLGLVIGYLAGRSGATKRED